MLSILNNFIQYLRGATKGIRQIKQLSLSRLRKVFSLMGKREKIVALTLLGLALVCAYISLSNFYYSHTVPAPGSGGIYTEGLIGQPTYINPLLASQTVDTDLTKLVFSGLYKYDANGQLAADLADGQPVISQDQKQYTVNLKKNVSWHNGKPFTADDVLFTIQTLRDPAYKSPFRSMWMSTTVTKLSDYSVQFTTRDISGPFVNNLTLPILPKTIWGRVDAQNFLTSKYNLEAIGTGPYAIKEIKKEAGGKIDQITLNSFANYYSGRAKIDTIIVKFYDSDDSVINALHSGEISGLAYIPLNSSVSLDQSQSKLQFVDVSLKEYQIVFFNLSKPVLADQNVRQALNLATDKQQIINNIFKGNALLPSSPFLFAGQKASSTINSGYNINQANKILDNAGWKIDPKTNLRAKKNQQLQFTITTNDALVNSQAAQALADQWKQLNIKVNLNVVPTDQLTAGPIKSRNFDVLLFLQKFGADPDPFLFWHSSQVKDPGFNLTGFADAQADKLIIDARSTTDMKVRQTDYQEFNTLFVQKMPAIILNQTMLIYATAKNVHNIGLKLLYDSSQRFYDTPNWYMETARVWK